MKLMERVENWLDFDESIISGIAGTILLGVLTIGGAYAVCLMIV